MNTVMNQYTSQVEDYYRIEQAILYLDANYDRQPSLKEAAESVHLSEYHFQRLFTRWVGISPKRFLQYLTKEHAKKLLEHSETVLDATFSSGLSSPGRLHDLFITWEAVTPGEYKNRGEGITVAYGFHDTPFGECLLALTRRGICGLSFVQNGDRLLTRKGLERRWQKAQFIADQSGTADMAAEIFSFFDGHGKGELPLHLMGSSFQLKVWEALLRVPSGMVVSYDDIALQIGLPGAARAVGNAVGRNPVPVVIPCHRVIRKTGEIGDYHWGSPRKKALLGWEMAKSQGNVTKDSVYSGSLAG
jgi:AraC family transcriptional regulator of adaptative response/methylated-DNA-[protein]-cysteine methyltransferase